MATLQVENSFFSAINC